MQDRAAPLTPRRSIIKRAVLASAQGGYFFNGGVEPQLDDMLSDPIVALVMQRDRVSPDDVKSVLRAASRAV